MDTIFMKSDNSKTSNPHILKLKRTSKLDLRLGEQVIALSNLSIYYTWKSIKSSLPDGSYSVSDVHDYFEYILKKHGENNNKPSIQIYVNKIENRITFKIKNGHSLELLTKETIKLFESTENKKN